MKNKHGTIILKLTMRQSVLVKRDCMWISYIYIACGHLHQSAKFTLARRYSDIDAQQDWIHLENFPPGETNFVTFRLVYCIPCPPTGRKFCFLE